MANTTQSFRTETSDEVFKSLVEGIKDYAIFMLDPKGTVVSWNLGAERIKGYKANEIIGKHFSTFYRKEDVDRGHPAFELEMAAKAGKYEEEGLRVRKDGSVFAASILITALYDADEKFIGFSKVTRDITELQKFNALKSATEAVENERQNFRNLFQHTPEMVCILRGPEHLFEFVNQSHIRVLGADATGKTVRQAQPESIEVHGILDHVYRTGLTSELHEIPVTIGHRLRHFNLTYSARRDTDGTISGVMILGTEVTDTVIAREGTALQNEALQLALKNAPLPEVLSVLTKMVEKQTGGSLIASLLIASEDGKRLLHGAAPNLPDSYNNAVHGIAIGAAVGSCGTAAFRKEPVFVEDIQSDPLWNDFTDLAAQHKLAACWSTPILEQNGKLIGTFALYSKISRKPSSSEIAIMQAAAQTTALIIERQRSEQQLIFERHKLETVFQETPAAMALWRGEDFVFEKVNPTYQEIFPDRELIGKPLLEACPEFRDQPFFSLLANVLQTGDAFIGKEFPARLSPKMGGPTEERHYDFSYLRINDANGKPYGVYNHAFDVTDRVLARKGLEESERNLIAAKEAAEHANELKSAFLANMSHEIRTPLGAMMGFADLLKDPGVTASERQSYANILSRNGDGLAVIINDILDLSKIEAGHLTLEFTDTYPDQVGADVVSLLRVKANEKDLILEYVHDEESPRSIVADPTRVRQILLNLVGNAIKFTQFGSVQVKSFGCKTARGRDALCFEVSDTGMGVPASQRDKIFEMFVQADGSMTRRFGGTGLGLALSRSLARAMGGEIVLTSSHEGVGSTFLVTIEDQPEKLDERTARTAEKSATQLQEMPENALKDVRILVVDDAPDNQQLIWRYLTKQGAVVTSAEDGLAGYRAALLGQFDLVLMDIQMPVMDGYSATQKLRETGYRKPIIALTAHAMSEVRKKALNVGYTDHLTKPINAVELIRTIAKHVLTS